MALKWENQNLNKVNKTKTKNIKMDMKTKRIGALLMGLAIVSVLVVSASMVSATDLASYYFADNPTWGTGIAWATSVIGFYGAAAATGPWGLALWGVSWVGLA